MAIDEFTMKLPAETEPFESRPSPPDPQAPQDDRQLSRSPNAELAPEGAVARRCRCPPLPPSARKWALTFRRAVSSLRRSSTKTPLMPSARARRSRQNGAAFSPRISAGLIIVPRLESAGALFGHDIEPCVSRLQQRCEQPDKTLLFTSRPMLLSLKYSAAGASPLFGSTLARQLEPAAAARAPHVDPPRSLPSSLCRAVEYPRAGMPSPSQHRKCRFGMRPRILEPSTPARGDLHVSNSARDVSAREYPRTADRTRQIALGCPDPLSP